MSMVSRFQASGCLRVTAAVIGIGLMYVSSTAGAAGVGATSARARSRSSIPENAHWTRQVLDPSSPVVTPLRAWATGRAGDVSNTNGVVDGRSPSCVKGGGKLVLDYGRETGGLVDVAITSAEPQ